MNAGTAKEEPDTEEEFTFEQHVEFCQLMLERKLQNERISPKGAQSLLKSLKILQSEKASFIKKRQVMRVSCGDYRKDMRDMYKSSSKRSMDELNRNKVEKVDHGLCRQFARKKASNTDGEVQAKDSAFRFNFPLPECED